MATAAREPLVFTVRGPIRRADLPGLCERVCGLLERSDAGLAVCDVAGVVPDAVTVDALARLQLAALRHGCRVRLRGASPDLRALVRFMGLGHVLVEHTDEPARAPASIHPIPTTEEEPVQGTHRKLFVNLPVADLDASVRFFEGLGFEFDPRFTDETATCMLVGEDAYVMLLTRPKFRVFTTKELADPATSTQAIMAVTASGPEEVDALADRALATGGSEAKEPLDLPFMYSRSFHDPDGHVWEVLWMDPAAVAAGPPAEPARVEA